MRFSFTSAFVSALVAASAVYGQASGPINCKAGTDNSIQKTDLQTFIANLNKFNELAGNKNPLDLRSQATLFSSSQANFREASFTVHIVNNFVFASTHVSFSSLAGAIQDITNQCCGDFPTCIGGTTTVAGDTGLTIVVSVNNLGENPG